MEDSQDKIEAGRLNKNGGATKGGPKDHTPEIINNSKLNFSANLSQANLTGAKGNNLSAIQPPMGGFGGSGLNISGRLSAIQKPD